MSEIIGYIYIREVDSIGYPIYDGTLNLPNGIIKPVNIILSKTMKYKDHVEEIKNPLFPEYIYINNICTKNINDENGKPILSFKNLN
jgi:hypothetical protein